MEESVLFSFEAEYGVVGAMLLDPDLIDMLGSALDPSDFYDEDNADLFALIVSCRMSGIKPDVIVLSERMPILPSGEMTLSVAASIVRNTPSTANAMHYAAIVKERAIKRSLRAVGESIAAMASSGESLEAILAAAQGAVMSIGAAESGTEYAPVGEYVDALIDHIDESFNSDGEFRGLRTGLNDLDDILLGMRGGHMVVIGGRPGTGKTTLAMNIIENITDQQKVPALVFSLEMSAWELSRRMLCSLGRIPLKSIDTGSVLTTHSSNLAMAALKMKDIPVFVSDKAGMTMSRIRAVSRLAKRQHDIGVIAIDYLGLVQPERTNSNHSVTIAEISRQCKLLAKELDIPVLVLCQLNRSIESRADKTPMLSDLRDSGAIEQDADMIVFTHKDDHPEAQGLTRLVVAKHRHGAPGECRVVHRGDLSRFETLAPGSYSDY